MENKNSKNAVVTLAVGLALNILLGAGKLTVGLLSGSVSVSSDALNNLSDAAVSVVTIIATVLAARKADRDHPYGHGRYEYIATFVVGAAIFAVGAEVLIGGIKSIVAPEPIDYDTAVWSVLGAAIGVKAFMAAFYYFRGRGTDSDTLKAAAVDSISDVAVTTVVLCCAVAQKYTGAFIDGYASVAVAVFIILMALKILKSTISQLLGERPDPQLCERIKQIICSNENVISVHDIVVNDYGATKIAEADAVLPAEMSFVRAHAVCDLLERTVEDKLGIQISIHADPDIRCGMIELLRTRIEQAVSAYGATAHDISVYDDSKTVELDICLSSDKLPVSEIVSQAEAAVRAFIDYDVHVNVDYE